MFMKLVYLNTDVEPSKKMKKNVKKSIADIQYSLRQPHKTFRHNDGGKLKACRRRYVNRCNVEKIFSLLFFIKKNKIPKSIVLLFPA